MIREITYKINILARIILLQALGLIAVIIFTQTHFWLVSIWIAIAIIMLMVELFFYLHRSRKALKEFLLSICQEDFSHVYNADESDETITRAYRLILDKFRDLRIKKESHYHYLLRIVEHVDTALICIDQQENLRLINKAAKDLLEIPDVKDLKPLVKIDKNLVKTIREIRSGQKEQVKIIRKGKLLNISVRATEFVLENDRYKIVSLQDIKTELEEQEIDSWQKLVRVLTHEIMNSTVPITNMVTIAREILADTSGNTKEGPELSEEEINDIIVSLNTAETRGKALMNFVKTTKSLTDISKPSFRDVSINKLFSRIHNLFKPETDQEEILLKVEFCQPDVYIKADLELLEQVIINLIRNAIEALGHTIDPVIELTAKCRADDKTIISVHDNGQGIEKEVLDQIFVPFFSTKIRGSGVGLSLSRQIMKLHKGRIDVESEPGTGSCFKLEI